MKVLVTGSRDWPFNEREVIYAALEEAKPDVVIQGGAFGADGIAKWWAWQQPGVSTRTYPADWKIHGKAAGPIRNQEMLDREHLPEEPIDLVLAFPGPESRGTYDMRRRAEAAGIPTRTISRGTGSPLYT